MFGLAIVALISSARAESPVFQKSIETGATCEARKQKYLNYLDSELTTMPANLAMDALGELERLKPADPVELKAMRDAVEADFVNAFGPWVAAMNADCPTVRLSLTRAIMKSASTDATLKAKVKERVTKVMKAPRYPTMIEGMIDIVLIDFGVNHGFWNAPPKMAERVHAHRMEFKKISAAWNEAHGAAFDGVQSNVEHPSPADLTRALKASPHLTAIKAGDAAEREIALKIFVRNAELMNQLN